MATPTPSQVERPHGMAALFSFQAHPAGGRIQAPGQAENYSSWLFAIAAEIDAERRPNARRSGSAENTPSRLAWPDGMVVAQTVPKALAQRRTGQIIDLAAERQKRLAASVL